MGAGLVTSNKVHLKLCSEQTNLCVLFTIATDLIPVEALALGLPGPGEHGQQEGEQVRPETEQEAEQERDHYHEDNDTQASRLGVNLEQKY